MRTHKPLKVFGIYELEHIIGQVQTTYNTVLGFPEEFVSTLRDPELITCFKKPSDNPGTVFSLFECEGLIDVSAKDNSRGIGGKEISRLPGILREVVEKFYSGCQVQVHVLVAFQQPARPRKITRQEEEMRESNPESGVALQNVERLRDQLLV